MLSLRFSFIMRSNHSFIASLTTREDLVILHSSRVVIMLMLTGNEIQLGVVYSLVRNRR